MKIKRFIPVILAIAAVAFLAAEPAAAAPSPAVAKLQGKVRQLQHRLRVEKRQTRELRAQRNAAQEAAGGPIERQVAALALSAPPPQALSLIAAHVLTPLYSVWPCRGDASLNAMTDDTSMTHITLEVGTLFAFDGPCAPARP